MSRNNRRRKASAPEQSHGVRQRASGGAFPALLADGPWPVRCATARGRLLERVEDGMDAIQSDNDAERGEGAVEGCWNGKIVRVHWEHAQAASALFRAVSAAASEEGYVFGFLPRSDADLDEDSDRRVYLRAFYPVSGDAVSGHPVRVTVRRVPDGNAVQ